MKPELNFYLPFSKVEKEQDGSRTVTGYASTPTKDLDGEIVSLDAIKGALPNYMEWRNIRQMHQPIAVGVAKEASVDETGLYVTARIVDPACIKLLDEEVLKGYSIGGKKLAKKGDVITELELIEISLVDRPANPDCRLDTIKVAKGTVVVKNVEEAEEEKSEPELSRLRKVINYLLGTTPLHDDSIAKRAFDAKQRQTDAGSGKALPDGSFPIENKSDLRNAIQAHGRAKDKEAAKKHIISRAKSLGCTDMLPDGWTQTPNKKVAALKFMKENPELFGGEEQTTKKDLGTFKAFWDDVMDPVAVDVTDTVTKTAGILAEVSERLVKGVYTIQDLASAFSCLRGAQRSLIREGVIEGDGEDHDLADRLGVLCKELGSIISQKAEHEGSEAVFLTDADDRWLFITDGEISMNARNGDLAKRAGKALFDKTNHHLRKAGGAQAAAVDALKKCALMHGAFIKSAGATEFDHKAAMTLMKAVHGNLVESDDHLAMAHGMLEKAAVNPNNEGPLDTHGEFDTGNHIEGKTQGEMTEGDVPWWGSVSEDNFTGKRAAATVQGKGGAVPEGYISKAEAELITKNAVLEARLAVLSKTPAGERKGNLHVVDKTGLGTGEGTEGTNKMALLSDGVDFTDDTPEGATRNVGKLIGNMLKNPRTFAKSIMDPSFRGAAGGRR